MLGTETENFVACADILSLTFEEKGKNEEVRDGRKKIIPKVQKVN